MNNGETHKDGLDESLFPHNLEQNPEASPEQRYRDLGTFAIYGTSRGKTEQEKAREKRQQLKARRVLLGVTVAALVAAGLVILQKNIKAQIENIATDSEIYKNAQMENIADSKILAQYGVDPDDIKFGVDSMEFLLGDGTKVMLRTDVVRTDEDMPRNLAGGYYEGEAISRIDDSQTRKTQFEVEQEGHLSYVDGIPIDKALEALGLGINSDNVN